MAEISVILISSFYIWLMPEDTTAPVLFIIVALIMLIQKVCKRGVK